MRIRKEDLRGTGKVYRFTLKQMLKGRTYLITSCLLLLIAAGAVPVMTRLMGGESEEKSGITAVYVQNESGYDLAYDTVPQKEPFFSDTSFQEAQMTEETYGEQLTSSEVYVHITRDPSDGSFHMWEFTLDVTDFFRDELDRCTDTLTALLDEARYSSLHADPQQMQVLMSGYKAESGTVKEYRNPDEDDVEARLNVQMMYCVVVLMLSMVVIVTIIQTVIEEKASKLAETLLVSVQPFALLLGKIFAVMTYVFGQLALMAAVFAVSYQVTGMFADTSAIARGLKAAGISADLLQITPVAAVIVVVSLLLAYVTVSFFSGLVGACCSTTEDVEPANLVVVMFVMVGYLVSVTFSGTGMTVVSWVVILVPFVSMFAAPVRYLLGDIGLGPMALSLAVQLLVCVTFISLCARMYRSLMMYRGERLKLKGFLGMVKQDRREVQQ